jgi:hypothetical protein
MPRPIRKQSKVRLNLDMPGEIKEQLEELRDLTHADSMSEVIRRALAVYDCLWAEKVAGGITVIRDKDGKEKQLLLM